ncbi:hypothetical protein HY78_10035 [Rhizorhabdus wittichii DC-6]|nr:hypothetical protein HY78_10035 [Rhizorhabdus wittichii DC-6]
MKLLRISPHKPMTLIWWSKNRHLIDFDPPYQRRGRLWSARDKAYLIDTIINGFDVPKLYLADFQFGQSSLNSNRLPYAIIDGKQRLEAVFDFFDNQLVLNDDFKLRKDASISLGGLSLKDIKSNYASIADDFENAYLDIMSVFAEDEQDIHEIFVRLNRSKPLTGAEVRNAIVGPVPEVVRMLATHDFFEENIRFGVSRAGDLNAAAKILLFEYEGKPTATKKNDLDKFANENADKGKLELAGRRAVDNLNYMADIFIPKDILFASAGMFPVYYWFVKGINPDYFPIIREYILWFEAERKKNRDRQKGRSGAIDLDRELSRFDTLNRSTNDLQSHIGRVEILDSYLPKWIEYLRRESPYSRSNSAISLNNAFVPRGQAS